MRTPKLNILLALTALALAAAPGWAAPARPSLQQALANLKVPPAWFNTTTTHWDTNKPWKDRRLEIRRLLAGNADEVRQGMKLTYLYRQKNDINNGHEYPMYLFMGGEYAWALVEYTKWIPTQKGLGGTHNYLCLASCYAHFGEYQKALQVLNTAMGDLQAPPWQIAARANVEDALGDLYAEMGNTAEAKKHYAEAIRLYPTSTQPYGRQLLARQAAKCQTKSDLLTMGNLQTAQLRDGTYTGKSLGYVGDIDVTVTVRGGKMADIRVQHQEKIDLGASDIIPKRIVNAQSLRVDAITGATVTSVAIVDGTFQALKKAGLR